MILVFHLQIMLQERENCHQHLLHTFCVHYYMKYQIIRKLHKLIMKNEKSHI